MELLNSAIDADADAVTIAASPLIGRTMGLGSAAVMLCIALAATTWLVIRWW